MYVIYIYMKVSVALIFLALVRVDPFRNVFPETFSALICEEPAAQWNSGRCGLSGWAM